MFKIIILLVAVGGIALVVAAALQPKDFRISRRAILAAPPSVVFAQVNDMQAWQTWSPWARLDPQAKMSFSGPTTGVGAAFSWVGNNKVGSGAMTITESQPGERVRFRLDFLRPMAATNAAEFTFTPVGGGTEVTWTMTGQNGFLCRAVGLFMNMDKLVGGQFEQGLANLRCIVETKNPRVAGGS